MSDDEAQKRAQALREQIAALRRGEKPKCPPGSIRDAVDEAAGKVRDTPARPPEGGTAGKRRS